jgi:hypothetical protein
MVGAGGTGSSRLPSGLAAPAYRDDRRIWTGQVISNVGSSTQQLGPGSLIVQLAAALAVGGGVFSAASGAALLRASALRDEPGRAESPASATAPGRVRSPVGSPLRN